MRIVFFVRRKKRTRTPLDLALALREIGHNVKVIRYGNWRRTLGQQLTSRIVLPMVRRFRPDLVLVWKDSISVSLLTALSERHKTMLWSVDSDPPPPRLVELAQLVDLFLLTNKGQLPFYRELGAKRAEYLAQACGYAEHETLTSAPQKYGSQVAFIGRPRNALRQDLLHRLDQHFELNIWGPGWDRLQRRFRRVQLHDVRPDAYSKICAASEVILGIDHTTEVELFFSNRTWLTLGCGGFFVINYCPGLETFFENHKHLVWYHSTDECVELIQHYLDRPGERRRIARAGCEYVHQHHTYVHRAREITQFAESLPEKNAVSSEQSSHQ
jgi:glycosyl transferase family 1